MPVEDFFKGPGESDLQSGEVLSEILIPRGYSESRGAYLKLMRRGAMDLAQLGVAVCIHPDPAQRKICRAAKIALGAAGPTPLRAPKAEGILAEKEITQALAKEAGKVAIQEARPRSSIRASKEYREAMIEVLTARAVMEAVTRVGAVG